MVNLHKNAETIIGVQWLLLFHGYLSFESTPEVKESTETSWDYKTNTFKRNRKYSWNTL